MTVDTTQEDIVEDLRRVAELVGRAPSKKEYSEHGKYSTWLLYDRFDGLNDAREQAGLDNSDTRRAKEIPREDLLEAYHELKEELGRVPKREEMVSEGGHSEDPYRRVFGSWSEAVQAAGDEPHRPGKYVSEKVDVTCAWCGKTDTVLESRVAGQENYFHNRDCKSEWQAENIVGEDHHQYAKVYMECAWCGTPVERKPAVAKKKKSGRSATGTVTAGGAHMNELERITLDSRAVATCTGDRIGTFNGDRHASVTTTPASGVDALGQSPNKSTTGFLTCIISPHSAIFTTPTVRLTGRR